jgi:hypothetical protein
MRKIIGAMTGAMVAAVALPGPASADGLASCTESPDKLHAMAQQAIDDVGAKVPLGPYEDANTVLLFVQKSLTGVGDVHTPCADVMAYYVIGRQNGTINAPLGPGLK